MKKKIWSLLLVLCLALAVVGCKKQEKDEDEDDKDEKVKATQELKNDGESGDKKSEDDKSGAKSDVPQNPGISVEPKEDGSYVATYLKDVAEKNNVELNMQGGITLDASVSFKGTLLEAFTSELSAAMGEEVKKQFDAGLKFDIDYAEKASGLTATLSLNGKKLALDAFLQDKMAYIGAPDLSSTYVKVDLTEALEQVTSMLAAQEITQNQEKYTKLVEELANKIQTCVTAEKVEENAVVAVKNTQLGIDTQVTGTKQIDKIDVKKLFSILDEFVKEVSGDSSVSVPEEDVEAGEVFVLTNANNDVVFGIIAEKGEIVILNNKDYMAVAKNETGKESDVLLFAKKNSNKSGQVFFTPDGEVVDDFDITYEVLDDGIKITLMAEVEENIVSFDLTLFNNGIGLAAKVMDDNGEIMNISASLKGRAYKAHNANVTTVEDPMEWVATLSQDKLMEFLTGALGVSEDAVNNLAGAASGMIGGSEVIPDVYDPISDPAVVAARYTGTDEYQKILYSLPEFALATEAEDPVREKNIDKMVMFYVSDDSVKKYGLKDTAGDNFVEGNKSLVDKICKIAKDATKEEPEKEQNYEVFGSFGSDLTCFLKNVETYMVPTKDYSGLEVTITKVGEDSISGIKVNSYLSEVTDDNEVLKTANEILKALGCTKEITKADVTQDGFTYREGKIYVFTSLYEYSWNEEKPYRLSINISKNIFEK